MLVYPKTVIFKPTNQIPLGLAYIGAVLEDAGHNVWALDLNIQEDNLENFLKSKQINVVGISATTPLIKSAWKIAERVKKFDENISTVIGGPHVSALPDESLENEFVDFVVRGEGEMTTFELWNELEGQKRFDKIAGLSFKKNGKIIHNIERSLIEDLDTIPFPARHLFPSLKEYTAAQPLISNKKSAGIFTSRGCPYGCCFCFKAVFGRKFRTRSVENVLKEWEFLVKEYGAEEIAVQDDAFNLNEKRAIEICNGIIERGLSIDWCTPNGIRADWLSEKMANAMKKSGCYLVWFGVESGNQEVVTKIIGKALNLETVKEAVKTAQKQKIQVGAFFVLGNPGETAKTMDDTINFALKLNPDYCQFTIAGPFPGTNLRKLVLEKGNLLLKDWDYYGHYQGKAYFDYENLFHEIVEKKFTEAYRRFYFRPQFALKLLTKKSTYLNLPNILLGALKFLGG